MGFPAQGTILRSVCLIHLNDLNPQFLSNLLETFNNATVIPEVNREFVAVVSRYFFRITYNNFTYPSSFSSSIIFLTILFRACIRNLLLLLCK